MNDHSDWGARKERMRIGCTEGIQGAEMRLWTNTEFIGHWPVGTAAVVVAESAIQAAELLNKELKIRGLSGTAKPEQFHWFSTSIPVALVLCDGNY